MRLAIVRIGQCVGVWIPVTWVICDVRAEGGEDGAVEPFDLSVCLLVVGRCERLVN